MSISAENLDGFLHFLFLQFCSVSSNSKVTSQEALIGSTPIPSTLGTTITGAIDTLNSGTGGLTVDQIGSTSGTGTFQTGNIEDYELILIVPASGRNSQGQPFGCFSYSWIFPPVYISYAYEGSGGFQMDGTTVNWYISWNFTDATHIHVYNCSGAYVGAAILTIYGIK